MTAESWALSPDDAASAAGLILGRRVGRSVVSAYAKGVHVEQVARDLGMGVARVRAWTTRGVPKRSVLEIVSERAVEGLDPDQAWADLLALDWWEYEPTGPTFVPERIMGPRAEIPQAMMMGLLSPTEMEKLFADVSPRRVDGPVIDRPWKPTAPVPVKVSRAARVLMAIEFRRAVHRAAVLGGMDSERISRAVDVPQGRISQHLASVERHGIDPGSVEGEVRATLAKVRLDG